MFPFLAFAQAGQFNPTSSRASVNYFAAPWVAAPLPKSEPARPLDLGDVFVDFLREAISFWASHYETLGNRAHLLFTQIAAALAFERAARETSAAVTQAYAAFGLKPPASVAQQWSQPQFLLPLTAFTPGGIPAHWAAFNPWFNPSATKTAFDTWGAVAESFNVWTKAWQPAVQQKAAATPMSSALVPAKPITATVTAPGGFNWTFSFGV
ncbi:hypothetical protein KKP04_04105 [Rhodomicrobium sp. Az07]|uniref:hypothetical protein n=1 Tax=Rhodomicrobium sp. Az07 TaxID=2839034 RepID=UPI001BEB729F|nr:hypothetical protein [Rhodomicrobium sp. Az07]MBT3070050.1 hypothetical protein [Rhodomicrobium sp. Az07]